MHSPSSYIKRKIGRRLAHSRSAINKFLTPTLTVDQMLFPDDAAEVLEELLPAQNHSFMLGMKLKLHHYEVEAIHSKYTDPRERLLHVILLFLKQEDPQPTWGVVVKALWSPVINLPWLARKVRANHFPKLTIVRSYDPSPESQRSPTTGEALFTAFSLSLSFL